MIGIADYGVGNLFSLRSSFAAIGKEAFVSGDPAALAKADRLILPGVGAFGDAADKLKKSGLDQLILAEVKKGKLLLGICLGMQLLFEESEEYGTHRGLGLIPGRIQSMQGRLPDALKIPHIGWNSLHLSGGNPLWKYTSEGDYVYFVHSYYAEPSPAMIASADYGRTVCAAVNLGNVFGCQFHPEKSGSVGLGILRAFCEMETK